MVVTNRMRRAGAMLTVALAMLASVAAPAMAAPDADPYPNVDPQTGVRNTCASQSGRFDVPGLWLGHFNGGRWVRAAAGRALDWRDQYSCFTSLSACAAWQRDLQRIYRDQAGYRTCLPLRAGGRRVAGRALYPEMTGY